MAEITRYSYFYDAQIKRYIMQLVRAFSGFQYQSGARGVNSPPQLNLVPCIAARRNRQAAAIQRNNSQNTLLTVPMITIDMISFGPDRERMQYTGHVDSTFATERAIDPITGEYGTTRGNRVTVERLMPRSYIMTVQVDIWTSTMDQKHQLLEQIDTVIFPSFDIQNSDNPLDWSALTTATFKEQVWSSLSIPVGPAGENEIDVATITLEIPMWLSPPALLKRQVVIEQININVRSGEKDAHGVLIPSNELMTSVTTPGEHGIFIENGYITLLGPNDNLHDSDNNVYSWDDLLNTYKAILRPSETQLVIRSCLTDSDNDIVGTIQPTSDPNIVMWQPSPSSLPSNTIAPVTAIINPLVSVPGDDNLPDAATGQRYLLLGDLAGPSLAWGSITARAGSIIQYQSGAWVVSFDSTNHETIEYVLNSMTGRQLKWDVTNQAWVMAIDGTYQPGYWRLGIA